MSQTGWRRFVPGLRRLTFRARLSTLTAVAVGLTVTFASLISYFTVRHQLYTQVDDALLNDLNQTGIFVNDPTNPFGGVNPTFLSNLLKRNTIFQVIHSDGSIQFSTVRIVNGNGLPLQPTLRQDQVAGQPFAYRIENMDYEGAPYRVITESTFDPFEPETAVAVQVARPLTDLEHTLSTLRLILWLVSVGGIVGAVVIGYIIGRATLRPVARLTAAAEHVAATQDLESTIEADGEDELTRLARAFNSMLVALASSRQQQAQLISDAGHELRTPLTSLRTNFEVLVKMPNLPPQDRAELVSDIEGQMGELTSLIGDLVDMARQEEKQPEPIEVRLDAIVGRAVERAKRRAPGLRFEISMDAGSVKGQPALLERAVLNVLDNAAKWSPVGGTVEVTLRRGETWTLDVRDRGPGISAADLPYVFDRFYRAANARSMPGSGLGLAIVHQVISNHGGTVALSVPPDGGTLVHIELPIVVEAEMEEPTPGGGLAGAGPVPETTVVGEHPFLLVEVPTTDAALVETRPEPPSFLLPTGPTLIAAEDPSSAEGHEVSGASDDASPSPSSPPVEAGPPASAAPDDRPVPVPGAPSAAPPPGEDHVPAPARAALFPNFS